MAEGITFHAPKAPAVPAPGMSRKRVFEQVASRELMLPENASFRKNGKNYLGLLPNQSLLASKQELVSRFGPLGGLAFDNNKCWKIEKSDDTLFVQAEANGDNLLSHFSERINELEGITEMDRLRALLGLNKNATAAQVRDGVETLVAEVKQLRNLKALLLDGVPASSGQETTLATVNANDNFIPADKDMLLQRVSDMVDKHTIMRLREVRGLAAHRGCAIRGPDNNQKLGHPEIRRRLANALVHRADLRDDAIIFHMLANHVVGDGTREHYQVLVREFEGVYEMSLSDALFLARLAHTWPRWAAEIDFMDSYLSGRNRLCSDVVDDRQESARGNWDASDRAFVASLKQGGDRAFSDYTTLMRRAIADLRQPLNPPSHHDALARLQVAGFRGAGGGPAGAPSAPRRIMLNRIGYWFRQHDSYLHWDRATVVLPMALPMPPNANKGQDRPVRPVPCGRLPETNSKKWSAAARSEAEARRRRDLGY